jgi:hypothetical protein
MYYAHSAPPELPWEPLKDHLLDVAERAAVFAKPFGATDEARLAGLLHDLGKYSELFTLRLQGRAKGLDHWSIGAWAALTTNHCRSTGRLTGGWIRRARRHTVSLYRPKPDNPVRRFLRPAPLGRGELSDDWFLYTEPAHYDRELLGLREAPDVWIA